MSKKTKIYAGLSKVVLTVMFASAIAMPVSAASTDVLVKDDCGIQFQYSIDKLVNSFTGDKKLYNEFLNKGDVVAYYDSKVKQYVDVNKIIDAFLASPKSFDLDKFTENAPIDSVLKVDSSQVTVVDSTAETATARTVSSVSAIIVPTVLVGTVPTLPTTVNVTLSDGTIKVATITWNTAATIAATYANAGTVTITGTLADYNNYVVSASVTVNSSIVVDPTNDLKTKLDSLVAAGTITEDQENAVLSLDILAQPTSSTENPEDIAKTKLDSLVTAGTITEDQETAILNALKPSNSDPNNNGGSTDDTGSTATTGTATYLQSGNTVTQSNQNITASNSNQSAIKVTDSGTYTLSDSTITTTGDTSSMDDSSFYGLNAAVLAESGSKITLSNTTVNTSGSGANGVFACGEGSTVNLSDVTINCTATGAHGVDATKSGVLNLNNVNITTSGDGASGAIATDRGGGIINVTGGVVTTNGTKSPGIYSTGDITVSGTTFKTNKSEAVTIEGENSATVKNCTLTSEKNYGVFIYQSFSGDAEVGSGTFTMEGGSLTANEGPMFYSTNTTAVINLKGATLNTASGILLKAGADQWGTTGSNGSNVTINADSQSLVGSVVLDNISTADLVLQNSSVLKSTINSDNTAKSIAVSLDSSSSWNVTGNCYITSLTDADTTLDNIDDNGFTIYYNSSDSKNSWLNGKAHTLKDGGKLTPMTTSN